MTYTSTLDYAGKSDEFGEMLKCKITHSGKDLLRYGRNTPLNVILRNYNLEGGLGCAPGPPLGYIFGTMTFCNLKGVSSRRGVKVYFEPNKSC